jgi:hypothetical protein
MPTHQFGQNRVWIGTDPKGRDSQLNEGDMPLLAPMPRVRAVLWIHHSQAALPNRHRPALLNCFGLFLQSAH